MRASGVTILNCHALVRISETTQERGRAPSYFNQAIKHLNLNVFSRVNLFAPKMLLRRPNQGLSPLFSLQLLFLKKVDQVKTEGLKACHSNGSKASQPSVSTSPQPHLKRHQAGPTVREKHLNLQQSCRLRWRLSRRLRAPIIPIGASNNHERH